MFRAQSIVARSIDRTVVTESCSPRFRAPSRVRGRATTAFTGEGGDDAHKFSSTDAGRWLGLGVEEVPSAGAARGASGPGRGATGAARPASGAADAGASTTDAGGAGERDDSEEEDDDGGAPTVVRHGVGIGVKSTFTGLAIASLAPEEMASVHMTARQKLAILIARKGGGPAHPMYPVLRQPLPTRGM